MLTFAVVILLCAIAPWSIPAMIGFAIGGWVLGVIVLIGTFVLIAAANN